MNELERRQPVAPRFSLLHLLAVTALFAIATAVAIAYRKNRSMVQYRDELISLSNRLHIANEGSLTSAGMPRLADDFLSWNVSVPDGKNYELRLGIGDISEFGVPPVVGVVHLSAGNHRVTLYRGDSPSEEFRYVVYVNGKPAIEHTMGSDWMPGGWWRASGLSWPGGQASDPAPLQLSSLCYRPRQDVGIDNHFNGDSDYYVTYPGYRLWIDQRDRAWEPPSPFIELADDLRHHGMNPWHHGIGLRDGMRYQSPNRPQYEWSFTRPQLQTNEPVWKIAAEFFTKDGSSLTSRTPLFQAWQLRDDASDENSLDQQSDPTRSVYSAYLQAHHESKDAPKPILEMRWDTSRPNEVGLRIADSPANDEIRRWRLRIYGGTKHLWRELQFGDRLIKADKLVEDVGDKLANVPVTLDGQASTMNDIHVQWQTNESLPLQVVARKQKAYRGMPLYDGLPVTFGIQIPASLKPTLDVKSVVRNPVNPGHPFPGGAVLEEFGFDLDATNHEWIWLETKPK